MQAVALRSGDLPIDVFRSILSTLDPDDDKPTLSACALLSRTCSDVARPILFHTIAFFCNELAQIAEFVEQHPNVGLWIRKLRSRLREILELDLTILVKILSHLPALRELHFGMLILTNFPAHFKVDQPIRIRKLLVSFLLSDRDAIPYAYPALLSLLSPDTLEMGDTPSNPGNILPPDYAPVRRPIRRLVLGHGATTPGDFTFLRALVLPNHLQSLTMQLYSWLAVRNACEFIRDVATGLTAVDLDACLLLQRDQLILSRIPSEPDDPDWGVLGKALCECDKLESIRIRVPPSRTRGVNGRARTDFETRYTIFTGIFSPGLSTLRRVAVRMDSTFTGVSMHKLEVGVELWDLSVLDRVLSKDQFPRLDSVTVEIVGDRGGDQEGIGKEVRKALPNLGGAGLLRIVDLS